MSTLQNDTKNILSKQIQKQFLTQIRNDEIQQNLRSSYVNVNSVNRNKTYKFQFYSSTTLTENNPILFNGTNEIVVYHPNNNLDVTKNYNVILTGIKGDIQNQVRLTTVCNYPLSLINFKQDAPENIFTITEFTEIVETTGHYTVEDNYVYNKSDYYKISLKKILSEEQTIRSGYVGGDNVTVKIIKKQNDVFLNQNKYKIQLPRTYRNIVGVRLISTEIPNITNTIDIHNNELRNNRLQWINEDDKLKIVDKFMATDHTLLNSLNHYNYINSEHVNSIPGRGSDSDGSYTIADLKVIPINSNPTANQITHAASIITELNDNSSKETAYYHLTNTNVDTSGTVTDDAGVSKFQSKSDINELYKQNRYFTPKKMFKDTYLLENNYHSIGKTLSSHIETLISNTGEDTIRKTLPWEYNYYKIYNSRGRQQEIGTNLTWNDNSNNNNPLRYLGYQVFDNLIDNTLGYSETRVPTTSTILTEVNTVKNTYIPKNLLYGTEMIPQDPTNVSGITSTNESTVYPINSIFLDEGIYNIVQLMDVISNKLNTSNTVHFDWTIRDWRKSLTTSNKYILQSNIDKRIFELNYDFTNSIIKFHQYKFIPYNNSLEGKTIDEKKNTGITGAYFIVNEGYPHLCVVNEGHLFKNGSFLKINNANDIFNINQNNINKLHNIIVNPTFKIHLRSIFPIPLDVYFRKSNPNVNTTTATKLGIHQIDSGNISNRYDKNTPDSNYKILLEIYGSDILNLLNKGTVDNILNYVGSKLSQNYQDQNTSYPPPSNETFTKFKNHITETSQETIHNPENPFILNELFILYRQALGESDKLTIGRVVKKDDYSDSNGNFILDFELLTGRANSFKIGDIIVGMESNAISMIVPYYWNESRFPSKNELNAGMREYLITKNNFNTHIPDVYWNVDGSKTKNDNSMEQQWYLQEVYNGEVSYSIDVDTVPNESDIAGISNELLEILKPVKFSLLSGLENNLTKKLGFKTSKEGIVNERILTDKINIDFKFSHSNTVKSDILSIKSSKFVKMYDNKWSNYLMIECYDKVPYEKGDKIYFENHVLNKFMEQNFKANELLIKRVYPLKDWFYSIESRYIHHILSLGKITLGANPFTLVDGSTEITVTHNEHGLNVGDKITIEGSVDVKASQVTASNMNVTTSIDRIVSKDSYVISPTIDATPETSASLGNNPFSVTNGSDTITVTHSSHSLTAGTKIVISGATDFTPAGYITATNLNVTTEIISVTDSNTYTITPSIIATPNSTTTGGGASVVVSPYVYGGGSSVKITIDYPTTTLGTNPVSITNGSTVITVTHTAHGLLDGDIITIAGATTVLADKVLAADLNVTTPITSVSDANTYTITPLLTATPNSTTTGGGSAITITHNAAAGVMHKKIKDMKRWFYQNVNKWTNYNIDYKNFIIRNYLYPRVLHGETQVIIHISKILLKESTGNALSSTLFIPGMTLTHNSSVIGLKVLGITKRKHKTDTLYNEEPVKNINDISNGDYYYVYFQRLSTVSLSGLDAGEAVTYTDASGSANLRSASGTLVTIAGESVPYVNDASIDYLYYFYLADKTILEYKTPITKEEENYIEQNNINITDELLKINPFSGSDDYPYISKLSYDPNNSNIEYGQTVGGTTANSGPFYLTNGSNIIRVTHPYHGLQEGDEITITGAITIIASRVTAYNLNVTTKITKIIDETYYNIEPTLDATPNSTTYGGGALVKLEYRPESVDVNINAMPISALNPGDNIYITNHQKMTPKYYEEGDVIEADELYMNRLKGNYYDQNTNAVVNTTLLNQRTGIKNGNCRILSNLWAGMKSDNYFMNKYWPGRTVLTDIEWTDEISRGFLNQGGKIRTKTRPYHIIGNNDYDQLIKNKLKIDSVNDDLSGEFYSVLAKAITTSTTESVTSIIVKHGVNFRVGGVIVINPVIYSQHSESDTNHTQQNTITELNIITAVTEITDEDSDYTNSFTLTLQFPLLNNHLINSYVLQKGYSHTLTTQANSGANQITINNTGTDSDDNPIDYFVVGDIINIGFNSYYSSSTLPSGSLDTSIVEGTENYYREQLNRITAKSGTTLTLQNTLVQTYKSGTYVVKMAPTILDNNSARHNYLATQNVLIRGEWYTKIFYQGPDTMEDIRVKDGEYSEGANAFNKYSQKEVYISGMKGLSIPQLSFDNHSEYITDRDNLSSVTTKTSYHIEQTTPVPDGFYTTYPNIEQDGRDYLMTDYYNIPIKGGFYVENPTPYEKNMYWRDSGYSREETLSSSSSSFQIGTTAIFGQEIDSGERNETQHIQAPTPTNNEKFGHNVKIFENYLAVGSADFTNGKVYIYYKNQATGVYSHQKTISQPSDLSTSTALRFGAFVQLNSDYLVVSASYYPNTDANHRFGIVYIYKRKGTDWSLIKTLDASQSGTDTSSVTYLNLTADGKTQFGRRISMSDNYILIGAPQQNSGSLTDAGKLLIFEKNSGGTDNWGLVKTLSAPGSIDDAATSTGEDMFGASNSIDGDYIIVGAFDAEALKDSGSAGGVGLAYIYYRHQGGRDQWGLQESLYPQTTAGVRNIPKNEDFGWSVSIKGRYAIVGAPNNDRAYIFYRTGTQWSIQQRIENAADEFGSSVVLSPFTNYCVIGAKGEGKVYVYKRTGTTWSLSSELVHSDSVQETDDNFGVEVAYDGLNILVGANGYGESGNDASKGSVFIFKQTNTTEDGNGILAIDDHTTHELYLDGEKQKLSVDYSFTNNTNLLTTKTTLGNNPITTVNTSSTITISHPDHDLNIGDYITISGATTTNNISAAQINVTKDIASITDKNTYTVTLPAGTANANGTGGGSAVTIQKAYSTNTIAEHSIDGWRKIYETGRQFNCILIKGKYLGYGGQIEFRDKENIMEHPEGYEVKQVIYTDDNIELPSFKFLIDLEQKQTDFTSTLSNERTVPSSSLYKNLNIIESNNLFTNIIPIGLGGKVYKLIQDEPVNVDDNFVNLCIKDFGTMENVESNTIDDIFAKILLPSGSGAVHYDTFTTTEKEFYDKPLRELTELEISFVNNKNQLVDFNGYDHSFTLEIIELDEELLKINPTSGMVI